MSGRKRTGSRVAAVQALFQSEQAGTSPETVIDEFIRHRLGERPARADSRKDACRMRT